MCRRRLDLAFLIDGSGSIEAYGRGNFRRCLNFVRRVVASFHISPRHTRVGVVLFASRAWLVFNFRRFRNKHGVLYAISRIRYPRGGTRIGRALRFARYRLFKRRNNRRKVSVECKVLHSEPFLNWVGSSNVHPVESVHGRTFFGIADLWHLTVEYDERFWDQT